MSSRPFWKPQSCGPDWTSKDPNEWKRELRGATIDHASKREVVEVVVSDEVDAA